VSTKVKPRVAVFKMASCDGCQLQFLDAERALLELAGAIEIVNFAEASSRIEPGPYDITLVEGSVSTPEQEDQIREEGNDPESAHDDPQQENHFDHRSIGCCG